MSLKLFIKSCLEGRLLHHAKEEYWITSDVPCDMTNLIDGLPDSIVLYNIFSPIMTWKYVCCMRMSLHLKALEHVTSCVMSLKVHHCWSVPTHSTARCERGRL